MSVSSEAHSVSNVSGVDSFFHIRPITAHDGPEIHDIRYVRNRLLAIGTKARSLSEEKADVPKVDRLSATNIETLWMVAQANTSEHSSNMRDVIQSSSISQYKLLGYAVLAPHRYSQDRDFFKRTATLSLDLLEGSGLDVQARQMVQRSLLRETIAACNQRDLRYRTAVLELVYHDDYSRSREDLDLFQHEGFRIVGRVKRVTEIDGKLFDLFILQKDL